MKKILLFMIALMPMMANAFTGEVEIDGIKYFVITKGQVAEVRANRYSGDIVIPSTIECEGIVCNVTTIGSSAFSRCNGLTSISIPSSVTTIGDNAFKDCLSLTSVVIPNSVKSIGEYSFCSCQNLTSLVISDSLETIPASAFSSCFKLTSLRIPESVTTSGSSAFINCES